MKWVILKKGMVWTDNLPSEEECLTEIYDDTILLKEKREIYIHMPMRDLEKYWAGEEIKY